VRDVGRRVSSFARRVGPALGWRYRRLRKKARRLLGRRRPVTSDPLVVSASTPERGVLTYSGPDPMMSTAELERLAGLRDSHSGERIFILGNGPSLNRIDLDLLDDEFVFAMNRVSLLYERVSWRPQLYTAFDLRVVPDNLDEFNELEIPYKFFATKHKGAILEADNHYWYHDRSTANDFVDRFVGAPEMTGFGGGGTIACVAIQIAAFMGFDPIILIGCDASYRIPETVTQVGPDKFGDGSRLNLQSTIDDDANHFDPRYFGAGRRWHTPNAAEMHLGFEKCYRAMASVGRTLVNATDGGALECVPRVAYPRLFVGSSSSRPGRTTVGIDLTHEMAAKQTGMRNSLISTLRNTDLIAHGLDFVLVLPDDNRVEAYESLLRSKSFSVLLTSDPEYSARVSEFESVVFPFNLMETELDLDDATKRVAYLNDLIPIRQDGYPDSLRKKYEETASDADAIVCLSEHTRAEIATELSVDSARIFVAPPSVDDEIWVDPVSGDHELISGDDIAAARKAAGVTFTYVIYPAAFRPHKNHRRLLEAMRYVYTNLQLVLTTGETHNPGATAAMRKTIDEMNMSHRVLVVEGLPRQQYLALMKGAEALVFPSLDEGFGIPVLEAQLLRVPVVSSRCGSLAEVALGSLEIDPLDHRDIAATITDLTSDDQLKQTVADDGWTNARRYSKEWGPNGLIAALDHVAAG
jgi:glycosyltransferase involved in cell wall biosynthesis